MKPTAQATTKMRLRKSESGRIGSVARCSTNMNPTSPNSAATMSMPLQVDSHAIDCPPKVVNSITAVSSTASSPAPAKSIPWRLRLVGERNVDVEDPTPAQVLDEIAADQRPDDGRDAEHRAEQTLIASTFARRDDIADRSTTLRPIRSPSLP